MVELVYILIDAEQKAHFLYMTMRCCSPDAFVSASEPETDDEELYAGYADGEIQALQHGDEPPADSEDEARGGDISEDEVGDAPVADEECFADDEMEEGLAAEETASDGGEMEVGGDGGDNAEWIVVDNGIGGGGDDGGEMEVDGDADGDNAEWVVVNNGGCGVESDGAGSGEKDAVSGGESGDESTGSSAGEQEEDVMSALSVSGAEGDASDESDDSDSNGEMDDGSGGSGSDGESEGSSTGVQEEDVGSAWSVSDVEGDSDGGNDNGDTDDQIVRPVRHLRNVVGSDEDGEVTVRATHPPGTMAVFDELAPADINNPCEFQFKAL